MREAGFRLLYSEPYKTRLRFDRIEYRYFTGNSFVNKKRKFRLIKKGILGNNGDVIVDDVIKPKRIIGVCDKDGLKKNIINH